MHKEFLDTFLKLIEQLEKEGRVILYSNKQAELFKKGLDTVFYNYRCEDAGGSSHAPEMWRFFKVEMVEAEPEED